MRSVALILLSLLGSPSFACNCASLALEQRLRESASVFLGSVVAHQSLVSIELRVHEVFKGSPGTSVRIPIGDSDCDYFLPPIQAKPGDRFVIFMTQQATRQSISRCLGSAPESQATNELAVLRRTVYSKSETLLSGTLDPAVLTNERFVAYTDLWAVSVPEGDPIVFRSDGTVENLKAGLRGNWSIEGGNTLNISGHKFRFDRDCKCLFSARNGTSSLGWRIIHADDIGKKGARP